mmetsp:Transcript_8096/g.12294  ORF Transcript_8096/g.12294 Transcript_8096/m.12294 type:complete len:89 (-) Transcript_8096:6-272(-)
MLGFGPSFGQEQLTLIDVMVFTLHLKLLNSRYLNGILLNYSTFHGLSNAQAIEDNQAFHLRHQIRESFNSLAGEVDINQSELATVTYT